MDGERPSVEREPWGKVGIVGPVTTAAAGIQGAANAQEVMEINNHDYYAAKWRNEKREEILSCSFLSGFCMAFDRECLVDLLMPCPVAGYGPFDSEGYPIAGYEDNDLCVRARDKGWRLAVDYSNYVGHIGHASFDDAFPDMQRGMKNRLAYYKKWEEHTQVFPQRLVGVYRVRIGSVHDMHLFKASLTRHAQMLDGVSILLTNNPVRDMPDYPDWKTKVNLEQPEQLFLKTLEKTLGDGENWKEVDDIDILTKRFETWVAGCLVNAPDTRFEPKTVKEQLNIKVWTGDFNERDERNKSIEMAYELSPSWLISIDGDECIEDRVRRVHFDRLMTHPDPLVTSYNFGWIDHWNDTRHFRTDAPWGDSGSYQGGRNGYRMWRAEKVSEQDRIFNGTENGLHCGNLPDRGPQSCRVSGLRWRHFGYVRALDRVQRYKKYKELDPNPDPLMMGGESYSHIVSAEGMRIELFNAQNGIALHMLMYSGTDPGSLASLLDVLYPLVDHIVLVWTDDEDPEEAMSDELKEYVRLFKADLLHAKLRDEKGVNFAGVRNAAIDHISELNKEHQLGLGWGLFFDPDEHIPWDSGRAIRRMAETTETYGWLFQFVNPLRTGQQTPSDSVRLHRLEPIMRMTNRVHESFDKATMAIRKQGGKPALRIVDHIQFMNAGLSDPSRIDAKLKMYAQGLIAELEEDPYNGGAWHSLGLQMEAENRLEEAMRCYALACQTSPDSFIGYRSMMSFKLREATAFAVETMKYLSPAHPWYKIGSSILSFLKKAAAPPDNPATVRVLDGMEIPAGPRYILGEELDHEE